MIFWYILAGVCGGIIGGMGMGGGTLLIPILTLFLGIDQRSAQAINLVAFIPMAIVVCIINAKRKNLDYKSILKVVIPALPTGILTAIAVGKINSKTLSVQRLVLRRRLLQQRRLPRRKKLQRFRTRLHLPASVISMHLLH